MKNSLFNKFLLIGLTIVGSSLLSENNSATLAQTANYNKQSAKPSVEYRCIDRNGTPATVAYTTRGAIELIVWKSNYFSDSGYTPERRCQEVTIRFQQHSDAKNLRYISTGTINQHKVICISEKSGACKSNGLLITLQYDDNPEQVMRDLFDLATRQSSGGITRVGGRNRSLKEMVDLDKFLAESPTIDSTSSNSNNATRGSEEVAPQPTVTEEKNNSHSSTTTSNESPSENEPSVIENPFENF